MHSSIGQVRRLANWLVFKKQEVGSNKENGKAHKTWQVKCKEEILIIQKELEQCFALLKLLYSLKYIKSQNQTMELLQLIDGKGVKGACGDNKGTRGKLCNFLALFFTVEDDGELSRPDTFAANWSEE